MKVFTIENDTNNITVHNTIPEAEAVANAERFRNEPATQDEPAPVAEPATATPVAPQTPDVAPDEAAAKKKTTSRKNAPKSPKAAKAPRESSKTAQVVAMLQRPEGATLSEIMTYASHCNSLGRFEGFSLTKHLFDNLTPLFFCGGLGPGSS